jgi:glycosidase
VVYNHTSPDSLLFETHPEFFYRDADGKPGNKIGDWADVIDLDYRSRALWDYQIESLRFWASIVDGFRCDVASFVPLDFWRAARRAVAEVNPGCVWLAETVHLSFGNFARREGFTSARDSEAFDAFDIEYQYDVWESFERFLAGKGLLHEWTEQLNFQEALYRENYNKLRFLENHDQPRIASRVTDERARENYTAMLFLLKGTTLLYAGQEYSCTHRPSLFEREVFPRSGRDISARLARLAAIKKEHAGRETHFTATADDRHAIAVMERFGPDSHTVGIFSLRAESASVTVDAPDGAYKNLIDGETVSVKNHKIFCAGRPIFFTLPA